MIVCACEEAGLDLLEQRQGGGVRVYRFIEPHDRAEALRIHAAVEIQRSAPGAALEGKRACRV